MPAAVGGSPAQLPPGLVPDRMQTWWAASASCSRGEQAYPDQLHRQVQERPHLLGARVQARQLLLQRILLSIGTLQLLVGHKQLRLGQRPLCVHLPAGRCDGCQMPCKAPGRLAADCCCPRHKHELLQGPQVTQVRVAGLDKAV